MPGWRVTGERARPVPPIRLWWDRGVDVVVVGAGPAGWAVAHACREAGLDAVVVGPDPHAPWRATYGLWADQAGDLPAVHATSVRGCGREVARGYAVLDNAAVLARWTGPAVAGKVVGADFGERGATVVLESGRRLACAVVVDASGVRRVLSGGPVRGRRVEQTAYGVVLPTEGRDAVFMDWGRPPTFLYAIPLPGGRTLVEETSLARRPGLGFAELRARLEERVGPTAPLAVERVRFPLDVPPTPLWHRGCVPFGVAAGMVHPATGYSVGDAVVTAPAVAAALAGALPAGPVRAAAAARAAVWSPGARVVHALRSRGLRALLALPDERLPEFFGAFFDLPDDLQRAYLSGRDDPRGTAAAMAALFRAAPWAIRARLALPTWR